MRSIEPGISFGYLPPNGFRHLRAQTNFSNAINVIWVVQSSAKKYSASHVGQITLTSSPRLTRQEGRIAIVTKRGMGCDGRDGSARRTPQVAYGKAVWS
jgi:hypothetical protein